MTNFGSWAKRWNDASLRQMISSREPTSPRWPLVGMFTLGVLAGAIASYVVTQRADLKRLAGRAFNGRGESGGFEATTPISAKSNRANHRRKAVVEVT